MERLDSVKVFVTFYLAAAMKKSSSCDGIMIQICKEKKMNAPNCYSFLVEKRRYIFVGLNAMKTKRE